MNIATLLKVNDDVVFYSSNLSQVRETYYNGLKDGSLDGYDIYGNLMDPDQAASDIITMDEFMQTNSTQSDVYKNIMLAPVMISIVRAEMINTNLESIGVDPVATMAKLSDVISAVNIGMFLEAQALFDAVVTDAFLTTERIERYKQGLASADSITYIY